MKPWALLLVALPALPALAEAPTPPPPPGTPPATPAPPAAVPSPPSAAPRASTEVAGTVAALDLARHRLSVDAGGGRVEVAWDRNTLIYGPGGATTAGALQPGAAVKAGLDPTGTAYWIQVRPAPPAPPTTPPAPGPAGAPPATPAR